MKYLLINFYICIFFLFLSISFAGNLPLYDSKNNNFTNSVCPSNAIKDINGNCYCKSGYVNNGNICVNADQYCGDHYSGTVFNIDENRCACPGSKYGPNPTTGICPISCKDLYGEFGLELSNGVCGCSGYHKLEGGTCVMDYDAYFNKDKDISFWGKVKSFFMQLLIIIVFLSFMGFLGLLFPTRGRGRPYR